MHKNTHTLSGALGPCEPMSWQTNGICYIYIYTYRYAMHIVYMYIDIWNSTFKTFSTSFFWNCFALGFHHHFGRTIVRFTVSNHRSLRPADRVKRSCRPGVVLHWWLGCSRNRPPNALGALFSPSAWWIKLGFRYQLVWFKILSIDFYLMGWYIWNINTVSHSCCHKFRYSLDQLVSWTWWTSSWCVVVSSRDLPLTFLEESGKANDIDWILPSLAETCWHVTQMLAWVGYGI